MWIENWLNDRKQTVGLNGYWREVTSGFSPGSVLGLVLFNLFINILELGVSNVVASLTNDKIIQDGGN